MGALKYAWQAVREFRQRWGSYLLLLGMVGGIISVLVVPLLRWLATSLLAWGRVPYLSSDNVLATLTHQPLVIVGVLLVALVALLLVYLQFAVLLGGVNRIRLRQAAQFTTLLKDALSDLRHLRLGSFGFFIVYLVVIAPASSTLIGTELLAKAKIPVFIIDFLLTNPLVTAILLPAAIVVAYLGIRLVRVLPNTILEDMPMSQAVRASWQETRHHFWFYFWRFFWLRLVAAVLVYGWTALLYGVQTWFDTQPNDIAFLAAIITMTLLIAGRLVFNGLSATLFLLFLVAPNAIVEGRTQAVPRSRKLSWRLRIVAVVVGAVVVSLVAAYNAGYMYGEYDAQPLKISHRGVDGANGVQNTIPVLEKTAKAKPDYVEMDIHETKDHQFVVMHDENLKTLAGVDKGVHELTLKELTALTVRENGYSAKVPSFDDYLAAAERAHQKLIVEIKVTPQDSKQLVENFVQRYAKRLIANGDRVHSLDYNIIKAVKQRAPKLYTSFILPYNLVFPQTNMNAYTMEETTLDATFLSQAQAKKQAVWAWTINEEADMQKMLFLGVDGIITDNLSDLKQVIADNNDHPSYAQRLLLFSNTWDDFGNSAEN